MCDYCHNIQKWKRFNAPKDYLACIEYIQQLVTNGGFAPYHVNHNFIRPSIFGLYLIQRASGSFKKGNG